MANFKIYFDDNLLRLIGTTVAFEAKDSQGNLRRFYNSIDKTYLNYDPNSSFPNNPLTIKYLNNINGVSANDIWVNGVVPLGSSGYTVTNPSTSKSCELVYIKPAASTYEIDWYIDGSYKETTKVEENDSINIWAEAEDRLTSNTKYVFSIIVNGSDYKGSSYTVTENLTIQIFTAEKIAITVNSWIVDGATVEKNKNILGFTVRGVPGEVVDLEAQANAKINNFNGISLQGIYKSNGTTKIRNANQYQIPSTDTTLIAKYKANLVKLTNSAVDIDSGEIFDGPYEIDWYWEEYSFRVSQIVGIGLDYEKITFNGREVSIGDFVTLTANSNTLIFYIRAPEIEINIYHKNNCKTINVYDNNGNLLSTNTETDTGATTSLGITLSLKLGTTIGLEYKGYKTNASYWYDFVGWESKNGNIYSTNRYYELYVSKDRAEIYCNAKKTSGQFQWDVAKVSNGEFKVTANEWNRLNRYIDAKVNNGTTLSQYTIGDPFTDTAFNETINSIDDIDINQVKTDDKIYASYFDEIKTKVNAMTAN